MPYQREPQLSHPGTIHDLSDQEQGMAFLPTFVRARLLYLAQSLEWGEVDDEENDAHGFPLLIRESVPFTYYEVQGHLSHGYHTYGTPRRNGPYLSPINIWIASDDQCHRSLYTGGTHWLCPDSHYLSFDEIAPELLFPRPNPTIWWCIHFEEGVKVIRIEVKPPSEITESFPDGV